MTTCAIYWILLSAFVIYFNVPIVWHVK